MKILNTAKAKPGLMSTLERLALYSGMDNLTLFEINDGLEELFDEKKLKVELYPKLENFIARLLKI